MTGRRQSDIPEKNILKQPAGRNVATQATAPAAGSLNAGDRRSLSPRPLGKDKELEEKKKQAEQAEADKKKTEEEKNKKTKAENCAGHSRPKLPLIRASALPRQTRTVNENTWTMRREHRN